MWCAVVCHKTDIGSTGCEFPEVFNQCLHDHCSNAILLMPGQYCYVSDLKKASTISNYTSDTDSLTFEIYDNCKNAIR